MTTPDAPMTAKSEPRADCTPDRGSSLQGLEGKSAFYLLYLLFYFTPWFFQTPTWAEAVIGVAAALFMIPVYLLTMAAGTVRTIIGVAIALSLAVALGPLNGMSGTFAIYAVTLAASLRPTRLILIVMAIVAPIYWIGSLLLNTLLFEVAITSFIGVMAGTATWAGFNTAARMSVREKSLRLDAELAAVRERERIARDLHDVLGHTLTTIAVKSDLAGRLLDADHAAARQEILEIRDAARTSLRDVRAAVAGMNATTLSKEIDRARSALETAGIALDVRGDRPDLSGPINTGLGLALREAITNIIRHSNASGAQVVFAQTEGQLTITVEDNGEGPAPSEGEGLNGMRRRLELLGGHLETGRGEKGVRLVLQIPIQDRIELQ